MASLAAAAIAFGLADVIGGSGFLSVYLVGLAVGSTPSRYRRHLVSFHEGLAFAAQVALFIVLGLLVFPSDLPDVAVPGLALALFLMLVARPASVWASTAFNDFTNRERLLLGWAGLRGAVPIVLATFVLSSDVPEKDTIFNAVFFVVVVSAVVQGTTLERVAGRLGLLAPAPPLHEAPLEVGPLSKLELVDFAVAGDHAVNGSAVRELGLPRSALIAVINRGDETIPPRGSTVVGAGDRLFVLIPRTMRADLEDVFARWRAPRLGLLLEQLEPMLELGQPKLDGLELLAADEAELARDPLAGLLRQVGQLVDAEAQLRSQLVDELTEREDAAVIWPGHEGGRCGAGGAGLASSKRRPSPARPRRPRLPRRSRRRGAGTHPGSGPASAGLRRDPRLP